MSLKEFNLLELPPRKNIETKKVLKQNSRAIHRLGELNGIAKTIPNQIILINTLPLLEAKDSSAIENIITTHDELYKETLFEDLILKPEAKEVQNYALALKNSFESVKEYNSLTINHILKIQEMIINNNAGIRKLPGTELKNVKTNETVYIPPQSKIKIQSLLNNLETFINVKDFYDAEELIKMAIIHYQFESIHPFYDGNGRTGRIINVLYLALKNLLDLPILYLSRYIIKNKSEYYNRLQSVRENEDWEEWIIFMLKAVENTSLFTIDIIKSIRDLMQEYKHKIRKDYKFYSQDLLNNMFKHPYTKIEFLMEDLKITRQTAAKYLDLLSKDGFLVKTKIGKRSYYINKRLFDLFSDRS